MLLLVPVSVFTGKTIVNALSWQMNANGLQQFVVEKLSYSRIFGGLSGQ